MASYVVLTPPDSGELDDRAEFIRDGFSLPALIIPVLWLLWNRLWFAAVLLLLLSVAIAAAISMLPAWSVILTVGSLLLSLFVALEGNSWRINKKERQGWTFRSVLEAPNQATAEEIWFAEAVERQASRDATGSAPPVFGKQAAVRPASATAGPALGLLDYEDKG